MEKLLHMVVKWSKAWKLDISIDKSKFMSQPSGIEKLSMFNTKQNKYDHLKEVQFFKYLGVKVQIGPRHLYKLYNEHVLETANNYMYAILSLTKEGPDSSSIALTCLSLSCGA